jgi:hypothetical protein
VFAKKQEDGFLAEDREEREQCPREEIQYLGFCLSDQ